MEKLSIFNNFCKAIEDDPRISSKHISLYLALLQQWQQSGETNPFFIKRNLIMKMAKISGRCTYNKFINDLQDFGYILYHPSFNPAIGSSVQLNDCKQTSENENADYGKKYNSTNPYPLRAFRVLG